MKESKSMRELHKIREKIYEETKNMTTKEEVKYLNEKGKSAMKEMNLTGKRSSHTKKK